MPLSSLALLVLLQSAPPAISDYPIAEVPTAEVRLGNYLEGERWYAHRLGQAMGKDLRREWLRYTEDEQDKGRERAQGDTDDDNASQSFADWLDHLYRKRMRPGIILFSVGFAPLGYGLYIGMTLGEAEGPGFVMAGIGGGLIVAGATWWAVRGAQLIEFRKARRALERPVARLQWRGLAPTYDPRFRTAGVTVGFAF